MTPIGAILLVVLILMMLTGSRIRALLALVTGALFLSQELQMNVGGFNMFAFRFLELAGFFRVLSRKEFSFSQLTPIDRTLLAFYTFLTVVFCIRSNDSQIYQIGIAVDSLLTYFTCRGLLKSSDDVIQFLRSLIPILAVYTAIVLVEFLTTRNLFYLVGASGAGNEIEVWMRNGRPRCFGTFRNPSLLGTLGGTLITFYIALWLGKKWRSTAFMGSLICFTLIVASNSGGPLNCLATCLLGWGLWTIRSKMRMVRWGIVFYILIMAAVMKAPIWYLPARASSITGGDGWHRSYLMDVAFQHFPNWWFSGMSMLETADWFPYKNAGTGVADMTNAYLVYGLNSGVGAMALFIALLAVAFREAGRAMAHLRLSNSDNRQLELLIWSSGVLIAVHTINWFGITYFDQSYAFWFIELAILTTLTQEARNGKKDQLPVTVL